MLFSEPKIPQLPMLQGGAHPLQRFSALQRAENSSMYISAVGRALVAARFSALQRAENSSIMLSDSPPPLLFPFQCSSASRKFLNRTDRAGRGAAGAEFQCSSASRKFLNRCWSVCSAGSFRFQCSSASRKFLNNGGDVHDLNPPGVSVLFSEPKIPQ